MGYITVENYVSRFGEYETGLLTNESGAPSGQAFDSSKVEVAITDAGYEVDAYVGQRYVTPMDTVPDVAAGWIAAIARLKLAESSGRVSEAIKDAAARATRQLELLASGKLSLPIPEGGTAPEQAGSGDPLTTGDGAPGFSRVRLWDYTSTFAGGCDLPRWMNDCI